MKNTIKRIFSVMLVLCMMASLVSLPVSAEEFPSITDINLNKYSKIYFKCETNKDYTSYEVGEEIIFTMTLYADGNQISAPYFRYTLTGDDGSSNLGYVEASSGKAIIKTSLSCAGGVRLVVEPTNYKKTVITADNLTKFEGGAFAGVADIQTTVAEPLDFDEYWSRKLTELDACAPTLYSIEQVESSNSNFDTYVVKVNCIGIPELVKTNATWTAGVLTVPKNATAGELKLRLTFKGYGATSADKEYLNGYITFAVCAHSIEQLKSASYYNTASLGLDMYGFSKEQNANPDTSYFTYMLLRDVQAVRFLEKYFGEEGGEDSFNGVNTGSWKGLWNGETIFVSGGSQGGFQAIGVAGLVPEVTRVNAEVPWFADVAGNTVQGRIKSTFRPEYVDGLRYLDTAFFAKRIKAARVDILGGPGDEICPMYAIQSIYNNISTNVTLVYKQGRNHGATNSYYIDSTQTKNATEASPFGKDAVVIDSDTTVDKEQLAKEWKALTGRDAYITTDYDDAVKSDSERLNLLTFVNFDDLTDNSATVNDITSNIVENYAQLGYTNVGYVISGEIGQLSNAHKAILNMAIKNDNPVHLVSFGEELNVSDAMISFAGSVYNNQPKSDVEYALIGEDGGIYTRFYVSDDENNMEAYPIAIPYHANKNADISVSYVDGEIVVESNGHYNILDHYYSSEVNDFGSKDGCSWIICNGVMNIYGDNALGNTLNGSIANATEIIVNEGIQSIGANSLNVPTNSKVVLPCSLKSLDKDSFCGKNDFTIVTYDGTVGADFASENNIKLESLGNAKTCGTDVYWTYNKGTLTIFGSGNTIVSGAGGYNKTDTAAWADYYNQITKVVIKGDITAIAANGFGYMSSLKTVELSKKVTKLYNAVFQGCGSLETIYITGNEPVVGTADLSYITDYEEYVFNGASNVSTYKLAEDLTGEIGQRMFRISSAKGKLTELTIPAGVESIVDGALENRNLTSLIVCGKNTVISDFAFATGNNPSAGDFVDYIKNVTITAPEGSEAQIFANKHGLKYINIETGEQIDYSLGLGGYIALSGDMGDGIKYYVINIDNTDTYELLFTGEGEKIVTGTSAEELPYAEYADKIAKVTVKCGESIGDYAFAGMEILESVELPASVTVLGNYVFANCTSLKNIYVGETDIIEGQANLSHINSFGERCFMGTAIETAKMSKDITVIPSNAFMESSLVKINLYENVKNIGENAFNGCTNLATVVCSAVKYTVAESAFENISSDAKFYAYEGSELEKITDQLGYKFYSFGTVVGPYYITGDVNNDSTVNIIDAVMFAQYLANWNVEVHSKASDCNGDGSVDIIDLVRLSQYLAGWNIELAEPEYKISGDNEFDHDDLWN